MSTCTTHVTAPRVIGPYGEELTLQNMPSPDTVRWVVRRKAMVVIAVEHGLLRLDDALERYSLSHEEFLEWQQGWHAKGLKGLTRNRQH